MVVDRVKSREELVVSAVPQGTVVLPVLFIIFINDMESVVRCSNTGSFAVDTKISKRFASAVNHDVLQEGHQLKDLCG